MNQSHVLLVELCIFLKKTLKNFLRLRPSINQSHLLPVELCIFFKKTLKNFSFLIVKDFACNIACLVLTFFFVCPPPPVPTYGYTSIIMFFYLFY